MRYSLNAGYGQLLGMQIASAVGPVFGKILVVVPSGDVASIKTMLSEAFIPDTDGKVRFYATLEAAYAAATSNANDVILLAGHSTHAISDGIAWSKNRVHVIGMDGGDRLIQQGAKIELSGNVATAYVLKVTGTRNSFRNLKVIQSSTNAAALNVIQFAGEGNLYKNCSFIFGVVNNLGSVNAAEALLGEDAGTFLNCSFGTDVLLTSAARNIMAMQVVSGGNADGAKSNRFKDCEFITMSSSASAVLLKIVATGSAKFLNKFTDCEFVAVKNASNSAIVITNAIQSVASFVEGSVAFTRPATHNCTNGADTLTANLTIAGAPVFSSNAWEGTTPA